MLKKRLGATVIIKNGIAVQSIAFKNYLPIGKPEVVIKNLDNWGADEIIFLCIDSNKNGRPNFDLISKISDLNIRTPLIYGGGITNVNDAIKCIKLGADRVVINQLFFKDTKQISKISEVIGKESLVLSLNLKLYKRKIYIFDYVSKSIKNFDRSFLDPICKKFISEILLTDYENEGKKKSFNFDLLKNNFFNNKKILAYGGINTTEQFRKLFRFKNISSVILGNCLNYKESAIFNIKKKCKYGFRK